MVGTPAYMAPEQVGGKPVDYRTDIYSLGLIMYEVFTGAQAFQADNAVAVALKQMRESPVPPHEIEPAVPVPIERAILKCLEKEPPKRFQSVGDLEAALRAPGAPPMAQAAVPASPHYSSHAAMPSQLLHPSADAPKRTSPVAWILLGALLIIGGFAGWHSLQVVQAAESFRRRLRCRRRCLPILRSIPQLRNLLTCRPQLRRPSKKNLLRTHQWKRSRKRLLR